MKNSSKLIIAIIVILAVVAGIWWYLAATPVKPVSQNQPAGNSAIAADQTAAAANGTLTTSPTDTSDASLNADMSAIDSGLTNLNADAATTGN